MNATGTGIGTSHLLHWPEDSTRCLIRFQIHHTGEVIDGNGGASC